MARAPQRRPRRRARQTRPGCGARAANEAARRPAARARARSRLDGAARHARCAPHGFETWSHTYPSRRHSIAYLADALTEQLVEHAATARCRAVTHSMGGVIVRHLHDPRLRWERIVMLAPPNRGSRLAAGLVRNPVFRWFYGPAGRELADGSSWPAPPAPFAVIAGHAQPRAARTRRAGPSAAGSPPASRTTARSPSTRPSSTAWPRSPRSTPRTPGS